MGFQPGRSRQSAARSDFASRAEILDALLPFSRIEPEDLDRQVAALLVHAIDGRIKMYVTSRLLRHRQSHPELFKLGELPFARGRRHEGERGLCIRTAVSPMLV